MTDETAKSPGETITEEAALLDAWRQWVKRGMIRDWPQEQAEMAYHGFCTAWVVGQEATVPAHRAAERAKVAERIAAEIEQSVCSPGDNCKDRFCPDCIKWAQAKTDAMLARRAGEKQ